MWSAESRRWGWEVLELLLPGAATTLVIAAFPGVEVPEGIGLGEEETVDTIVDAERVGAGNGS